MPLGCPPASPAHPRECPRPGGAGQAPETSPSCCAQFQGSQELAHCPWRLPALAPAFGTSWKNPGGPTPTHGLAYSHLPGLPSHVSNTKVHPSKLEPVSCKTEPLTTGPRKCKADTGCFYFLLLSSRTTGKAHACFLSYAAARVDSYT